MKLLARYPEITKLEICLFGTPPDVIKQAYEEFKSRKNFQIRVQPFRWRKERLQEKDRINGFHQIVIEYCLYFLEYQEKNLSSGPFVKLYSRPLNSNEIKEIGLEPLPKCMQKEIMSKIIYRIS